MRSLTKTLLCLLAALPNTYGVTLILGDTSGDARGVNALDIQVEHEFSNYVASGDNSIAIGTSNVSAGYRSIAFGTTNSAIGPDTISIGVNNYVETSPGSTAPSFAIGAFNSILADVWNNPNAPRPQCSMSLGIENWITAPYSFALGRTNAVTGQNSFSAGFDNSITAADAFIFGSGISNSIAGSMMIGPSAVAKVTILPSGNVGIGTAAPTSKLHVVGDLNVTGTIINSGIATTGSGSTTRLRVGGTTNPTASWQATTIVGADGQNKVVTGYLGSSTNGAVIGAHNSALSGWADLNVAGSNVILRTNETERMRVSSNGNVGIGTGSPMNTLDVAGSFRINTNNYTAADRSFGWRRITWGGGQDKEWKRIARLQPASVPANPYSAIAFEGKIYDHRNNHGAGLGVHIPFSGMVRGDTLDTARIEQGQAEYQYVRVVRLGVRDFELQVRQPVDWRWTEMEWRVVGTYGTFQTVTFYDTAALVNGAIPAADVFNPTPVTLTSFGTLWAGKLGLGTSNPTEVLDVVGNAKVSGTLTVGGSSVLTTAGGSGANLTGLNAAQLTTGTIPAGRLPVGVVHETSSQTLANKTLAGATLTGTTTAGDVNVSGGFSVAGFATFNGTTVLNDANSILFPGAGIITRMGSSELKIGRTYPFLYDNTLTLAAATVRTDSPNIILGSDPTGSNYSATANVYIRPGSSGMLSVQGKSSLGGDVTVTGNVTVKNKAIIRVSQAGDIDMGTFKSGPNPETL